MLSSSLRQQLRLALELVSDLPTLASQTGALGCVAHPPCIFSLIIWFSAMNDTKDVTLILF